MNSVFVIYRSLPIEKDSLPGLSSIVLITLPQLVRRDEPNTCLRIY